MLKICKEFFDYLNQEGIRYCHWKSNEHLDKALLGKTDLDVLVHIDDRDKLLEAFSRFPFKRILSPPEKQFPGMEDYLGFDEGTGEFIHFHLHHYLVLGQKYIKNHHIPLENLVFDNLMMKHGVAIPCPEIELLFLIIRANLKVDVISLTKHAIKGLGAEPYSAYPGAIEEELTGLIALSDMDKFKGLLIETGIPIKESVFTSFIAAYSSDKFKFTDILTAQWAVLAGLKGYRRNKSVKVYFEYFIFYLAELPVIRQLKTFKRKTLDGSGVIISLVGADGSGKSTLIADLHKWLSWKLFVKQYYYGIPKDWVKGLTYYIGRGLRKLGLASLDRMLTEQYWMYVARKRHSIFEASRREVSEGLVVITDRFPLKAFHAMDEPMDGPRLGKISSCEGGAVVEREALLYDAILEPDRIFVLQVEIDELRRRKTDLSLEAHQIKAKAVNAVESAGPIVTINANRPYEEVILDLKRQIWEAM